MKKILTLHAEWMKEADYRKEYLALENEFASLLKIARNRKPDETAQTNPQ